LSQFPQYHCYVYPKTLHHGGIRTPNLLVGAMTSAPSQPPGQGTYFPACFKRRQKNFFFLQLAIFLSEMQPNGEDVHTP
jgi:hypothetical protein